MVLNVSTRKFRAVRLPEGDLAKARGDGTSKSAVSRRFVALSRQEDEGLARSRARPAGHPDRRSAFGDHVLVAAIGVDGNGDKHVLAVVEGATENTVVVQALIDNLLADAAPAVHRRWREGAQQSDPQHLRCGRRHPALPGPQGLVTLPSSLPLHLHASVKKALRQAWDQDDADKAERLLRNLARRLEHEEPGVSGSILEGLDEILTVIRLGLPHAPALACLHQHHRERARHGRQVTRNVKRWRNADGAQMDRRRLAGGPEDLPSPQGLSSAAHTPKRSPGALEKGSRRRAIETIMKAAYHQPAMPPHDFNSRDIASKKKRRVVAKVEWHPGELVPRVGFIVTNLSRPTKRVVAFYNHRGTAEQHIKEGKNAINWTRLSCRKFRNNAVRLQLHALAYNLGNFMRTLALPKEVEHWSMTTLRDKLVKIGAKVVRHGRYVTFQLAEVAVPRDLFRKILSLIDDLRRRPAPA